MFLPKYFKNNESGQVLVIFLLVLVIGLALVLSIASRTVTDIRQTTTSDESNRAYYAAESGVEDALKKIEDNFNFDTDGDGVPDPYPLNFTSVNNTNADVNVVPLRADPGVILDFLEYAKDDVAQINLMADFNTLAPGGAAGIVPGNRLTLHWGDDNVSYVPPVVPAIEVSFVTYTPVPPTWGIRKMTFDPDTTRANGFCQGAFLDSGPDYEYSVTFALNNPPCLGNNEAVTINPVIARVRFLYNSERVPFGVTSLDKALPQQGQRITSTGETPSGVTRRLEVNRFYPTLPAIFDYVLYNGSSGDLCKGSC